ncbi:hypothetical protein [Burkholderia glumae]|uniref:Uncharacterized protein n=1 Tax=Burkholderia glumae TaxID=337 RepID=A0AAP9XXT5_BURGL|nr:hypothetical protein [Burkholderia glumae]MCM2483828.1 hypothetical protein [Burkholderia glumae]MCM2509522.1 hypothetical protein [Burkholderia glumae]NVE23994.1 hypothetical protein [Burkholderia glumae]QPQ90691.1 hypothetical protein I6H06_02770 [Burkholderia glumae]QQM94521.1 hypothetical protein I6G78_22510 [Burkholderia glumae]
MTKTKLRAYIGMAFHKLHSEGRCANFSTHPEQAFRRIDRGLTRKARVGTLDADGQETSWYGESGAWRYKNLSG